MLPILSTSHCEFCGTRSCAHARKPSPCMAPIHLFTKQIVPSMYEDIGDLKSFDIWRHDTSFPHAPYKLLPSIKKYFRCLSFILVSLFHFHRTLFCGLLIQTVSNQLPYLAKLLGEKTFCLLNSGCFPTNIPK